MEVGRYVESPRVLAAVSAGASHRAPPSAASVSRWRNLQIRQGNVQPGPLGGDRNSRKTEAHADRIIAWLTDHRDGTVFELRDALAAQGITVSKSALHRTLAEIAKQLNPLLRRWIAYYGRYSRSALSTLADYVNQKLRAWIRRKFKRFQSHKTRASLFLRKLARENPGLFVHWKAFGTNTFT
ncbi:hypothetical protein GOB25_30390 [Sinorhizobium meliloti]|nr:hypothetical protein [Sinorhizobium meliloti]